MTGRGLASLALGAALLAACPRRAKAPEAGAEASTVEPSAPEAGPHYLLGEPPPPPVPADVPGQGPLPPYLTRVRKVLAERLAPCAGGRTPPEPAQLALRVGADGAVLSSSLLRSSADPEWDRCLVDAAGAGPLPPPPAELAPEGSLELPTLVFR